MIINSKGIPETEPMDQCNTCNWFDNQDKQCPFIEAMAAGVTILHPQYAEGIAITNCDFYKDQFSLDLLQLPTTE